MSDAVNSYDDSIRLSDELLQQGKKKSSAEDESVPYTLLKLTAIAKLWLLHFLFDLLHLQIYQPNLKVH